jgi:hypothetical protein
MCGHFRLLSNGWGMIRGLLDHLGRTGWVWADIFVPPARSLVRALRARVAPTGLQPETGEYPVSGLHRLSRPLQPAPLASRPGLNQTLIIRSVVASSAHIDRLPGGFPGWVNDEGRPNAGLRLEVAR